ncbi:MAG: TIM-barrel domain-containing protein [Bacteroidota bacterium]
MKMTAIYPVSRISVLSLVICFSFFTLFRSITTQAQTFRQLPDGAVITLNNAPATKAKAIRLTVVSDKIIHVEATPTGVFSTIKSLSVLPLKSTPVFKIQKAGNDLQLKTSRITVTVSLQNGRVSFTDASGGMLLQETATGNIFTLAPVDNQKQYAIQQTFEGEKDEAFYGLGQHQEGMMNYHGEQVTLLQQNSDVAVPFLVSNKNYGVLWDNYSISRFGDCRPFEPLSSLSITDKNGQPGALTATYSYPKKDQADSVFIIRPEGDIDYPFLNDQSKFPAGFQLARGVVTYEGNITAKSSGIHRFHKYSGGYIKIWIDGKLVDDTWRQSWNPETATIRVPFEKGKTYPIKISWIPDGGEAYLALKALQQVAETDQDKFSFCSEAGDQLDYYFVHGANIDEVISGYRKLTGKATLLPKWAMGFWQSRERYKTQEEILSTVAEFRKRKIGLDNIVLDWSYWKQDQWGSHEFDSTRFPDATAMIKTLHEKYHTQFLISVWPKYYTNTAHYAQMNDSGFLYKRNVELGRKDWIGAGYTSTFYDAYNPGARAAFWKQLNEKLYSKGVDGWWMDASEPDIHSNVSIEDRKDFMNPTALGNSTKYFNAYALQNAKGIYEGQRGVDPNKRVAILTRSAYAGMQRYAAITWSGDIGSRWVDMKNQISGGVNFSMSGMPYWTMDIGGFAVEKRFEKPNEADKAEWQEQMTRWYQFGAFAPIFRVHGQFPFREIFNTAPDEHPAYQSMLFYNRLRYRLMPYIYSLVGIAYHQDYTLMRGLVMDFPADKQVTNINDQFLFGPALLVNPVTEYKATSRNLYLPAGNGWYNAYNGKFENGAQEINAPAPYERMPLFIKAGSIIPMGPAIEYTMQQQADTLTIFIYTGGDAKFTLYEDEGLNYNYEKGSFSTIPLAWNENAKTFVIGNRTGSFKGMLTHRIIRIVAVNKTNPQPLDADALAQYTIRYNGGVISTRIAF